MAIVCRNIGVTIVPLISTGGEKIRWLVHKKAPLRLKTWERGLYVTVLWLLRLFCDSNITVLCPLRHLSMAVKSLFCVLYVIVQGSINSWNFCSGIISSPPSLLPVIGNWNERWQEREVFIQRLYVLFIVEMTPWHWSLQPWDTPTPDLIVQSGWVYS